MTSRMDIIGQNGNDGQHYQEEAKPMTMAERYPKYYKDVRHLDYIDVYRIHSLYEIDDPSGCLQHADKKILLSGVRTGGKPKRKDIEEARDTLTRWLAMQEEDERAQLTL